MDIDFYVGIPPQKAVCINLLIPGARNTVDEDATAAREHGAQRAQRSSTQPCRSLELFT
jgi:hypothetical protein